MFTAFLYASVCFEWTYVFMHAQMPYNQMLLNCVCLQFICDGPFSGHVDQSATSKMTVLIVGPFQVF